MGSEAATDRAMAEAVDVLGGLTLAVCCAGISHRGRVVGREGPMAQANFARVVTVNLIDTFLVCRAAATVMQHNDPEPDGERGVIVNAASIAAFDGQIGQAAYAASKGGVVSLTLPLARELASFGVRVVCIPPRVFSRRSSSDRTLGSGSQLGRRKVRRSSRCESSPAWSAVSASSSSIRGGDVTLRADARSIIRASAREAITGP